MTQGIFYDVVTLPELAGVVLNRTLTDIERGKAGKIFSDRLRELNGIGWSQLKEAEQADVVTAIIELKRGGII